MKLAILVSLTLGAACGGKSGSGSDKPPQRSEDEGRVVTAELLIALEDHATALEDHQSRAEVSEWAATSGC